jgi:hypothetical protein
MDYRPPTFYSHKELDDIGRDKGKGPRSPWGPIIGLVIIILVLGVIYMRY